MLCFASVTKKTKNLCTITLELSQLIFHLIDTTSVKRFMLLAIINENQKKIGGKDIIVEINENKVGKRKYNHGWNI